MLGTVIDTNSPLMAAGMDSIAATEFANTLAERFTIALPQTVLFDHPTIASVAGLVSRGTPISGKLCTFPLCTFPLCTFALQVTR